MATTSSPCSGWCVCGRGERSRPGVYHDPQIKAVIDQVSMWLYLVDQTTDHIKLAKGWQQARIDIQDRGVDKGSWHNGRHHCHFDDLGWIPKSPFKLDIMFLITMALPTR